jgi:hypothetical protein
MEKVQTAAHLVTRAAEHGGPMIFAQMGVAAKAKRKARRAEPAGLRSARAL